MSRARYVAPPSRIVTVKGSPFPIAELNETIGISDLIRTPRDMTRVLTMLATSPNPATEITIQPVNVPQLAKRCARTFDYWLADLRVLLSRASKATERDGAPGVKLRSETITHDGKPVAVTLWIEPNRVVSEEVKAQLGLL